MAKHSIQVRCFDLLFREAVLSCNGWSYLAPSCPSKRQILAICWPEKGSSLPTGRGLGRHSGPAAQSRSTAALPETVPTQT